MAYSPFALCIVVVVVCLLLAISVATAYERAGYGYVHRDNVWKTCHPKIHHGWLLTIRIISFLYCISILIYDIILWGPFVFEYYTQWSFALLIVYFGVVIGSSIKEILRQRNAEQSRVLSNNQNLLSGYCQVDEFGIAVDEYNSASEHYYNPSEKAGMDGFMSQIFYQIAMGSAFVTCVVYWIFIFPSYSFVDVIEMSMHAVNLVLLLTDIALNNMAFYWFRGAYFFIFTAVFIFFSWIIHALGENQWPYPFLDVSVDLAPLWYFCLCIIHVVAYGLVCGIVHLKEVCLRHCQPSQSLE